MDQSTIQLPAWYQSTAGPGISQTIISIAGNIIPVINFLLASKGINIMPATINSIVTVLVFLFFSATAALGYIRAKKVLGMRVGYLTQLQAQTKPTGQN